MTTENRTEIEEHIVDLIRARVDDGEFIPISTIEAEIPGTYWQRAEVTTDLWHRGVIDIVKVSGSPLVSVPWPGWAHNPAKGPRRLLAVA
ncbi:hypothetical protein [Gordonia sp. NPDC003376]